MNKEIIVLGAGKIGRGFAADVFAQGGYHINLLDQDSATVKRLKTQGSYTLYKLFGEGKREKQMVSGFTAFDTKDAADAAVLETLTLEVPMIALCVFPAAFKSVAANLAAMMERRAKANVEAPLDVIIFANQLHSAEQLQGYVAEAIDPAYAAYCEQKLGLSQAIVIRMAVDPTPEMLAEDELVVATNGYAALYVDAASFKGERPVCPNVKFIDNFEAWEQRKLFSYNMTHALLAYTGVHFGCKTVYEATKVPEVLEHAKKTLAEIGEALQLAYGFTAEEMEEWVGEVLGNMGNPYLNDALARVGSDPIRKLKGGDRLAGAALLCKQQGKMPYYLTKTMAYGFLYNEPSDPAAVELQKRVKRYGLAACAKEICGFRYDPELTTLICDRFEEIVDDPKGSLPSDEARVALYKKAWAVGFDHEVKVKGCAQCTLLAMRDVLGIFDENVFKAATAFSAGMSLCGDSACGGYSGGLMGFGLVHFRDLNDLVTKNKVGQYTSFDLGQQLHDRFCQCYGGVRCTDVHEAIYGQSYVLRNSEEKAAFEANGAHVDKCTTVVGMAAYMIAKIMEDHNAQEAENA